MSKILVPFVLVVIVGCDDFKEAMESDSGRQAVAPVGIATTEDVDTLGARAKTQPAPAATKTADTTKPAAEPAAKKSEAGSENKEQEPKASEKKQPNKGIIGKTTAKVVDAEKAKQNPKVVEVENKVSGSDPLSVAGSAYVSITSRASTLGFQQALKQHKALNGKNPTYEEFMQMAKQNRVEFTELPPYQMYGYDAKQGSIVILEDKAEKIRLYKKNGIPIEPADKQYE